MSERYPLPAIESLPADIREMMLKVQEKSGFVPNVFLKLARRPAEFRAFFAYHDALMQFTRGRLGNRDQGHQQQEADKTLNPVRLSVWLSGEPPRWLFGIGP